MRIIRTAALIGSLVLLVGTMISILNRRDDLSDEYNLQLRAASVLATNSVEASLERAFAITSVAGAEVDVQDLDQFAVPIDACVVRAGGGPEGTACTGQDLTLLDAYRTAERLADDTAHGALNHLGIFEKILGHRDHIIIDAVLRD